MERHGADYGFQLTKEEVILLARLAGNHVIGLGLDRFYERASDMLVERGVVAHHADLLPLENATSHPYGDRNMVTTRVTAK